MHTILTTPTFDDRRPDLNATIWRISLSPSLAFKLLCDIGHLYPHHTKRPRVGAMIEHDGAITLYLWPQHDPDSALLMLALTYGAARLCDASRWCGQAWITGDLLGKVLAALANKQYWDLHPDPPLLADEVASYLLRLPRAVAK